MVYFQAYWVGYPQHRIMLRQQYLLLLLQQVLQVRLQKSLLLLQPCCNSLDPVNVASSGDTGQNTCTYFNHSNCFYLKMRK